MIKAAFFDIDGTLLSFKTHRIPASAQRVLDSFHEQGIACVIATGRPTYQMPDWLFDLGWDAYITLSGQHCFVDPVDEHIVTDAVSHSLTTRWCDLFCDIIPANGGKDLGVAATLERLGIDASEAIAFGDGENDLSMFSAVGTSVAMGNAQDTVKAAATYVTTAVDDDGIYNAAKYFGLL